MEQCRCSSRPTLIDRRHDSRRYRVGRDGRRGGFALVSALIVLVMVLGLGVSSLFVANLNITTTENARSQAIARNAAETGLDVARLALQDAFRSDDVFPAASSFTAIPTGTGLDGIGYQLVAGSYSVDGQRAMLEVLGTDPSGARYTMAAEFIVLVPDPPGPGGSGGDGFPGLLSETSVELAGGGGPNQPSFRDILVHANDQVSITSGFFETCSVERDANGDCPGDAWEPIDYDSLSDERFPVSTITGSDCRVPASLGGGTQCRAADSQTVTVGYDERLFAATGDALFADESINMGSNTCRDANVFCTSGDVTYTAAELEALGYTAVITDGNITITGEGPLTAPDGESDILLVSTRGGVTFPSTYAIEDVRVYSYNSLVFGQGFSASGSVTLASRGMTPFGNSDAEDIADGCTAGVYFQGQSPAIQDGAVTFLVVSEACIKVAGFPGGTTAGFFVAEGPIKYAGAPNGTFIGGAAAKGQVKFAGVVRSRFDAFLELVTRDPLPPGDPGDDMARVSIIVLR